MFRRLEVPTPFQVGSVNAYLSGRTLVDPGPDSERAWSALLSELEKRDMEPADVERVVITHPHPDHFGLAARFRDAGARVFASEPAADIVADFGGRLAYEQEFFAPFFERHGIAEETARTVVQLPEAYLEYAPGVETDRVLSAGDEVAIDGDEPVSVLEVAGHAPGELVFEHEEPDGTAAIVGDHVMLEITPNPLLLPPPSPDGDRPKVLPAFNESLRRLRDRDYHRLLPGHRDVVVDPAGRIDEILEAHEKRTEEVWQLVDGPKTAADVMEGLFGDLPATEIFPGMSEAVGHLDVLEDRGRVTAEEKGGIVVYHPA